VNRSSLTSALFLLVAIAALAAVLLWPEPGTEAAEQGGGMGDFRFPVTAALVGDGAVVESAELVGDVVSARRSTLAFDRNGTLLSVVVRMGDRVAKGQLLAELDDRVLAQDLASAQAAAEVAAEEAKYAEREAQRAREVGDDVVSDSERERLQSDAAVTARRLVQRLSEAARLQAQLDKGKLRAPFSGVIARRMLDEGAQAGPSAPVIDLVDPDHREIRLEVPAPLVGSLGVGSPVVLSLDERPEWSLEVALDALVPAADPGSRSFIAIVRIDEISSDAGENPNAVLLPGLFVRARLTLREVSGQPVVPIDALVESPRGFAVYAVAPPEAGDAAPAAGQAPAAPTAKLVPLRILARNASHAAVAPVEPGALAPGSRVVVTGVQNIFPGAPLGLAQGQ
jgi:RND family efflux transporter MFP subunit